MVMEWESHKGSFLTAWMGSWVGTDRHRAFWRGRRAEKEIVRGGWASRSLSFLAYSSEGSHFQPHSPLPRFAL